LSFSPDGAYLAFTKPQVDPSSEKGGESVYGDVFLLATHGSGREIPVVQHKAHDYALGWAPDGKQLLFASDRTGSSYVYSISIENGHPQGNPKLMRNLAPGDTPVGLSNDGSYFYGRMLPGEDIYMVNLNPKTGDVIGEPQKAIRHREGSQSAPAWSADSRVLACRVNLGSGELGKRDSGIFVLSENGRVQEIVRKIFPNCL
jgi:sugar lactone lactonase YvrE